MQNSTGQVDFSLFTEPATTVDVTTVSIHAEATPGASVSTVPLVDAPPTHGPPPGYRVTGITITPVSVVISGDPAAVGKVQRITLPAVDLSKSTSDATFQLAIDYSSLNVQGTVTVATVKYSISPNPNASP
jgi:YbbR domain-containing protein